MLRLFMFSRDAEELRRSSHTADIIVNSSILSRIDFRVLSFRSLSYPSLPYLLQTSAMASSASSGVSDRYSRRDRGIPRKCKCGSSSTIRTADTLKNPGRLFYCCPYGSKQDNTHLFKWTDISMVEEMEEVELVVEKLEGNIGSLENRFNDVEAQMDTLACETRTCEAVANSFAKQIDSIKELAECCEKEMGELKSQLRCGKNLIVATLVMLGAYWFIFA